MEVVEKSFADVTATFKDKILDIGMPCWMSASFAVGYDTKNYRCVATTPNSVGFLRLLLFGEVTVRLAPIHGLVGSFEKAGDTVKVCRT